MSRKRRPTPDGRHRHRHRYRSAPLSFYSHAAPVIIGLPVALLQNGGLSG